MRFAVLLALAAGGGCAALIYEVVWLQLLQLVIGSTTISLGVLLAAFMGGMCLGSLALPRVVAPGHHPLRVYAALELGIGLLGIGVWMCLPWVESLYAAGVAAGLPSTPLRLAAGIACLLPPTMLMGATLPALARWTETTPRGISRLGLLYGANIAGGVVGCLLAAFYLLRVHDTGVATFFAAAMNAAVAAGALALAVVPVAERQPEARGGAVRGSGRIAAAIAISGFCALGAEVVWTRLLSLMLGATVYTFALILAGFLLGLGIGGTAGGGVARRSSRPVVALAVCQVLAAVAVAGAAWSLAGWLPYWRAEAAFSTHPMATFASDFVRCLAAVFPAAVFWGASFPLAVAAAARSGDDPARTTARIYAANTLGAIAGALTFSVALIPGIGSHDSQRLLIVLPVFAALAAAWSRPLWAAVPFAALLAGTAPAVPWEVIGFGRGLASAMPGKLLYLGEGRNSSMAVTDLYGIRRFHVSGKVEASTVQQDMRVQRMLGHLPALLHPNPRWVLVVGCGAGVTTGSFVPHPSMERIVLVELEPLIPPAAVRFFGPQNHHFLRDPRVRVLADDARHHMLTSRETYDIITSDPIHPWVKGSAALYTREYFEMCKRRLNPGGIVAQWVPLYESSREAVKSELATFFDVFPDGAVWANETAFGEGYDVVLLAGVRAIDVEAFERRLRRADHAAVLGALAEVGFQEPRHLLGAYAGRSRDLGDWLKGAAINRDRNLRLQYVAGMTPDLRGSFVIYEEMSRYRRYPADLFVGGGESAAALRRVVDAR